MKTIAVFPGQGSQFVGMCKDLYDQFPKVKHLFEEGSDTLNLNLKKLCFDGPEETLLLTENTQPALLTVSYAAFLVAQNELGFKPGAVAGHSLGEYSALVAADCLPYTVALRWVHERGKAMQKAVPEGNGTMAAVIGLEDDQVTALCLEAEKSAQEIRDSNQTQTQWQVPVCLRPANFNSPGQVVIAGSTDAINQAQKIITSDTYKGGKALLLAVSAPFHSPLMKPARDRMSEIFKKEHTQVKPLSVSYIPNRTARLTQESSVVLELLAEQVDHPVLWRTSMETAFSNGYTKVIEFGPGKVLQGLAKRIAKPKEIEIATLGISAAAQIKELEPHV